MTPEQRFAKTHGLTTRQLRRLMELAETAATEQTNEMNEVDYGGDRPQAAVDAVTNYALKLGFEKVRFPGLYPNLLKGGIWVDLPW